MGRPKSGQTGLDGYETRLESFYNSILDQQMDQGNLEVRDLASQIDRDLRVDNPHLIQMKFLTK